MKCKIPGCTVTVASNSCSALEHNGVCRSCRGKGHAVFTQPRSTVDAALDKPPSIRNKAEWEAIRDKYSGHIKCRLTQGESIQGYQALYEQAVDALAQMPVQICPHELAQLRHDSTLLSGFKDVALLSMNPYDTRDPVVLLLEFLRESNVMRGRRL